MCASVIICTPFRIYRQLSVDCQKGVNAVQRCSIENQKGAIAVQSLYGDSALLVLNGISLNSVNTLLAVNDIFNPLVTGTLNITS